MLSIGCRISGYRIECRSVGQGARAQQCHQQQWAPEVA
jgi:hypothetical protein